MLFEAEFAREVNRQLAEKQSTHVQPLTEQLGIKRADPAGLTAQRFVVPGDDEHKTKAWSHLMKDCAFYYDVPTLDEERGMKRTLQRKYDNLLVPGWRPPLASRRDLLTWACTQWTQSAAV